MKNVGTTIDMRDLLSDLRYAAQYHDLEGMKNIWAVLPYECTFAEMVMAQKVIADTLFGRGCWTWLVRGETIELGNGETWDMTGYWPTEIEDSRRYRTL